MKNILAAIVIFAAVTLANAQSELVTPFFNDLFQTSYLNPATVPDHNVSFGLPGMSSIQMQLIHNGFVLNSAINGNTLSAQKLLDNTFNKNMLHLHADIDFLHFRIRIDNNFFWLGIRQRHNMSFFYPRELVELAVKGNAHLVGNHLDMSAFGINADVHREYTVGMARAVDDWHFGARISFLHGLSTVYMNPDVLELHVLDDMYVHALNSDAVFYSAGIPFDNDVDNKWVTDHLSRIRNPGFAIAYGADYRIDDQWNLIFSVSDLGFIRWSDNTRNYKVNGSSTFKGLDVLAGFLGGKEVDIEEVFDDIVDDLNGEEFEGAFTTWLSPRFTVAAHYRLNGNTTLRAGFYGIHNRHFYPAFSIGGMYQFSKLFTIAANASINQKSFSNLGLGFVFNPGPVQFFIMTDNFLTPIVAPASVTNVNFRFGLNFVLKHDHVEIEPVEI